jgi:hypothetical protein
MRIQKCDFSAHQKPALKGIISLNARNSSVFTDITLYTSLKVDQCFGGTCHHNFRVKE